MRGVLICGGTGSRLKPLTDITNKSLLPVYDKPLVLYPLQVLLDAGIRHIAVVTGTEHIDQITAFLGSGSRFGCEFAYRVQDSPSGIAQALGLAEDFAQGKPICTILGDNIYFDDLSPHIRSFNNGGHVFLKAVPDPERFGVATVETPRRGVSTTHIINIEEKPQYPCSNLAITGCYLYDNRCFEVIRNLHPSNRGEIEITDVSRWYLAQGKLTASILEKEWIDAGTFESLFSAACLIRERQSRRASLREPACRQAGARPMQLRSSLG